MILVTGASGFVGHHLMRELRARGIAACGTARRADPNQPGLRIVDGLGADTDWMPSLVGISAVVHLAARVHVLDETAADALAIFRATNVAGTVKLARDAVHAGVRRFVFLSSVKANGEATPGAPFTERDVPRPEDPYGISKVEAEQALRALERETGLEVAILRPPLVYGPEVRANFLRMMRWIDRGIPLPLAAVRNARSLVYVGNLVDAIIRCLELPAAAGKTFLVDDRELVSTPALLREIGTALARPAKLFPVSPRLLRAAAVMIGRREDARRILDDLVVDSSSIRAILGWSPPFTRKDGLMATAAWFRSGPR